MKRSNEQICSNWLVHAKFRVMRYINYPGTVPGFESFDDDEMVPPRTTNVTFDKKSLIQKKLCSASLYRGSSKANTSAREESLKNHGSYYLLIRSTLNISIIDKEFMPCNVILKHIHCFQLLQSLKNFPMKFRVIVVLPRWKRTRRALETRRTFFFSSTNASDVLFIEILPWILCSTRRDRFGIFVKTVDDSLEFSIW